MIRKIGKWTGIIVGLIASLLLIAYGIIYGISNTRINKQYEVTVRPIEIPTDQATIEYGAHLYAIKGCGDCHGGNLGGKVFLDDPAIGHLSGANLTSGAGGIPEDYKDIDWLRAMRHGVNRAGKSLKIMPSYEYTKLDDKDMSSLIAFCKAQPPVNNVVPPAVIGPVGRALTVFDQMPLLAAEKVDHQYQQPAQVVKEVTPEYGKYLAMSCTGCHYPHLKGGKNPIPGQPEVANITSSGHIGQWSVDEFVTTLRTGKTPEGKQLKNEAMPWQMTAQYTADELKALYLYLKSI
jgi:mono/diheme cytochrome c family protein